MFDEGDVIVTVETRNMVVTASQRKAIEEECDQAIQAHAKSIDVHTDPWAVVCTVTDEPATQNVTAEFIEYCNNHKRLKQIVT